MRFRAILFALLAFAAAGAGAWKLAGEASLRLEQQTAAEIATALAAAGQTWAHAETDGLIVRLTGAAPDETSRVKVVEITRAVVSGRRIHDETTIAAVAPLPPPPFALELLRNDGEVSLIGLVPESGGREVIRAGLGAGGLAGHVTDMLETADEAAPDGWQPALGYGLAALADLPRAKISVAPGEVRIAAVAESDAARRDLEARLRHAAPEGVQLSLEIGAPRPVIAPFVLDFALDAGGARLDRCSADTDAAAAAIVAAARTAGVAGDPACAVGLGTPTPDWSSAMVAGIEAVRAMGAGRFVASDIAATLTGAPGVTPEALNRAVADLHARLPDVFQLGSVAAPQMAAGDDGAPVYAPEFHASLAADGKVRLAGPVGDAAAREAVTSYAAALFSKARVSDELVIDPDVPAGWSSRVLAAIEGLSALKQGDAEVTRDAVKLTGRSLDRDATHTVGDLLAEKVGAGAVADITFDAEAAEAAVRATRPRPELCAAQVDAILDAEQIGFEKGSAAIAASSRGVIAAIADVLRGCPGAELEIGGHTDSQGSPEANRRLSEARAQAVLAALRAENLPQVGLVARGYGADDPVADNATEPGRAKNRRIEFTLVAPASIGDALAPAAPAPAAQAGPAAQADPAQADARGDVDAAAAGACAARASDLTARTPIVFEPGSSTLADESAPVIAAIADALRACPAAAIDVAGYTDAQGSEAGNLRLSQARAEAVLAALRKPDLPLPNLVAHGYGEANPVADNATEDGRAKNRRIEFVPVATPQPTPEDASARAAAASGSGDEEAADTGAADAGAADTGAADTGAAGTEAEASVAAACVAAAEARLQTANVAFPPGSAEIEAASRPAVAAVADALRACPTAAVEIGGHTDSQGSESGNARLSQARAEAVLAALRADGLALPNATAKGYGESQPVADNATADGRARNRRIAVTLPDAAPDAPPDSAANDDSEDDDGSE
ncbi:MAG: OmpA family protein [Amaricoccus sp.]|uniref:OmpA family protein n=1 Tax=Amaricoccus sp. TaxID=1872485 RepID=UPI0039E53B23